MDDIIIRICSEAQNQANRFQVPVYLFMPEPALLATTTEEPDRYFERFNPIPVRRL